MEKQEKAEKAEQEKAEQDARDKAAKEKAAAEKKRLEQEAADKAAARAAANTTLAKFVTNVESRIFANLSKQMVDNMFGTNCTEDTDTVAIECPPDGEATLPDGSVVKWVRDDTLETITLTVIDATGTVTTLIVRVGDFIVKKTIEFFN